MLAVLTPVFGFFNLGAQEMIILLIVGVLLFGRRLPEVGRYLGKGIVEFKKGIKGLEDDVDTGAHQPQARADQPVEQPRPPQRIGTTAPQLEEAPATSPRVLAASPNC